MIENKQKVVLALFGWKPSFYLEFLLDLVLFQSVYQTVEVIDQF